MIIQIKNMVCPRCVSTVRNVMDELDISYSLIELGKVVLHQDIEKEKRKELEKALNNHGFEILSSEEEKLVNEVKTFIINKVHHENESPNFNVSEQLSALLKKEYSAISKTFSHYMGITIEQYMLNQRVEKVKELLSYQEMTISEIAFSLGFSSVAHLSGQFKKITGMTPTAFKKLVNKERMPLDQIGEIS